MSRRSPILKTFTFSAAASAALLLPMYIIAYPPSLDLPQLPWCLIFDALVLVALIAAVATLLRNSALNGPHPLSTSNQSSPLVLPLFDSNHSSNPNSSMPPPVLTRISFITEQSPLVSNSYSNSHNAAQHKSYATFMANLPQCCVCLEDLTTGPTVALSCAHYFHERCILDWLKRKRWCPVCRSAS